jgi:hypothetical protein
MKNENHFNPFGIVQIARQREEKRPKKVEMDITNGRFRRKSLSMAKIIVVTSWIALPPVGIIF